jgi:mannose-1-phosphate guanylyltransferase
VVVGVPPTRAETGYGYVEVGEIVEGPDPNMLVRRVKRFTEKPDRARAEEFVASGNYAWNGGIFLWSARTLAGAIREHCPAMAPKLERIAAAWGTAGFEKVFAEVYPQCENISVDYAVLEPRSAKGEGRSEIYCVPGDFGWNDLGSWAALHEHLTHGGMETVVEGAGNVAIDAARNYVYAPGKMVAMVGVSDLVVVETEDALLITTRERSQDVGKVVAELKSRGGENLI